MGWWSWELWMRKGVQKPGNAGEPNNKPTDDSGQDGWYFLDGVNSFFFVPVIVESYHWRAHLPVGNSSNFVCSICTLYLTLKCRSFLGMHSNHRQLAVGSWNWGALSQVIQRFGGFLLNLSRLHQNVAVCGIKQSAWQGSTRSWAEWLNTCWVCFPDFCRS